MTGTNWIRTGAVLGFLTVAIGAFGAHGFKDRLNNLGTVATYDTGVHYQMFHAVAMICVGIMMITLPISSGKVENVAGWSFLLGVVFFCGSLYALALTGIKTFGAIAPIGGIAFLVGWTALMFVATSSPFWDRQGWVPPQHSIKVPDGGPSLTDFGLNTVTTSREESSR